MKLELWTFVNTHARWFRSMAEDYKKNVNPDFDLTVTEIAGGEMFDKLKISLQSGGVGAPDLADIEQGAFGGFLVGGNPGLVDLAERLKPYNDKLVATRQALYSLRRQNLRYRACAHAGRVVLSERCVGSSGRRPQRDRDLG